MKILASFLIALLLFLNSSANALAPEQKEESFAIVPFVDSNEESTSLNELNADKETENIDNNYTTFESLDSEEDGYSEEIDSNVAVTSDKSEISDSAQTESFDDVINKVNFNYDQGELESRQEVLPDELLQLIKVSIPEKIEETEADILNLKATEMDSFLEKKALKGRVWEIVKGERIDDSLLLGMFSYHLSNKNYNCTQNMLGIDYKGYSAGYFKNSYSKDTFYGGISRKIYERKFKKHYKFDVKYKMVLMHGYKEWYPDVFGLTPLIMPMFGVTAWNIGADFTAIPARAFTFTVNFRYNLPQKTAAKSL